MISPKEKQRKARQGQLNVIFYQHHLLDFQVGHSVLTANGYPSLWRLFHPGRGGMILEGFPSLRSQVNLDMICINITIQVFHSELYYIRSH